MPITKHHLQAISLTIAIISIITMIILYQRSEKDIRGKYASILIGFLTLTINGIMFHDSHNAMKLGQHSDTSAENTPSTMGGHTKGVVGISPTDAELSHSKGMLLFEDTRDTTGNIDFRINNDSKPQIEFKATKDSAGGVSVSNPEQYLYTVMVMKIHHKVADTRNRRELKLLAGNVPAIPSQRGCDWYKLLIKDNNTAFGNGKKLNGKLYYARIYRQVKPIEYKTPKDPKNYDIEQIADSHRLQSVGEYHGLVDRSA